MLLVGKNVQQIGMLNWWGPWGKCDNWYIKNSWKGFVFALILKTKIRLSVVLMFKMLISAFVICSNTENVNLTKNCSLRKNRQMGWKTSCSDSIINNELCLTKHKNSISVCKFVPTHNFVSGEDCILLQTENKNLLIYETTAGILQPEHFYFLKRHCFSFHMIILHHKWRNQ